MVGRSKKKEKKGSSSKKKTHIAAALVPTASFMAVPRTPPPQDADPEYTSGPLASGLLSSTMLGRLFAQPDPEDGNDVDTSLEDYTDPRNLRLEDRDRLHSPSLDEYDLASPTDPGYSSVRYERQADPMYQSVDRMDRAQSAPIYATPHKRFSAEVATRKESSMPDLSLFDNVLPDPHLHQEETLQKAKSSPAFSSQRDLETPRKDTPRTLEFRRQNDVLLRKQEELEIRLMDHEERQTKLFEKLEKTGDYEPSPEQSLERENLVDEQATLTDHTLRDQDELIKTLQDRIMNLESEKQDHADMNTELHGEIEAFRKYVRDREGAAGPQVTDGLKARRQVQELKDENSTLKGAIQRLNQELSQIQAKHRPIDPQNKNMVGLPSKGPVPSWLINTKYLAPLFLAYDDRLRGKDDVIRQYEEEMETFSHRVEEVLKENERLHIRLEQQDYTGPISVTEWQQLQEQAKLVLEENQLLLEQLHVQNEKSKQMNSAHVHEISKLSKRIVLLESDKQDLENALREVKNKCSSMNAQMQSSLIETEVKVTLPEHQNAIGQIQETIRELQRGHQDDLAAMTSRLESLLNEKKNLSLKLVDVTGDKEQHDMDHSCLKRSFRKLQKKALVLQRVLEEVHDKESSAQHYLTSVVKVAEQTAIERDTYAQLIKDQEDERKKSLREMVEGTAVIEKLEQKLQDYKAKATGKLVSVMNTMRDQEESFQGQRLEYERELKHLRLIVNDRDGLVDLAKHEKRMVEDELESMWQAATSDNRRMRDSMEKTFQKLRQHKQLESRWDDDDDIKTLLGINDLER